MPIILYQFNFEYNFKKLVHWLQAVLDCDLERTESIAELMYR